MRTEPETASERAGHEPARNDARPRTDDPASPERLRLMIELAPIGIGIVDMEGHTVLTNSALREMLGYTEEAFATLHWREFTHPGDVERNLELFGQMAAGRLERFEMDKRFFHHDGHVVWGRLTVSLLRDDEDRPSLAIGMLKDVTEERRLRGQLEEAEATYRMLVEQVPAVVYVAERGERGRWRYVSPQIEHLLGDPPEEWTTDPVRWWRRVHPDDREAVLAATREERDDGRSVRTIHYRIRRRDGVEIWLRDEFTVEEGPDGVPLVRGVLVDVTREKLLEARLEHQAFHDPLTGLANRARFLDRLEHHFRRRADRDGRPGAVLFIDLDDFKTVNDSLGHAVGDDLLRSVADRITAGIRPADTAARFGGDEFAVLLEDVQRPEQALEVAHRLQGALQRPHPVGHHTLVTAASFGVAYLADADDEEKLLRNADLAMYRAKELGKGCVATYEPALHAAAVRRLDLRTALDEALGRNELAIHLQPVVDLRDGRAVAAEALLRWSNPTLGAVPPADVIPVAEETGAIGRIGDLVLELATSWLATRPSELAHLGTVAVNVSPVQLESGSLTHRIRRVLDRTGLVASQLILEVTERSHLTERSREQLRDLRALGVRVALDDFGTGASTLANLEDLAVDVVKIDRSFVERLHRSARTRAVVQAIVQLARALELDVVAEGIETDAQWETLRELGCTHGQGFLFARPVPPEQLTAVVGPGGIVRAAARTVC